MLNTPAKRRVSWVDPTLRKTICSAGQTKYAGYTSEGTKKLGLNNFNEKGLLCRANEKS